MKNRLATIMMGMAFFAHTGFAQTSAGSNAQRTCGTEVPDPQWQALFNSLTDAQAKSQAKQQQVPLYTIPVIVHVIHSGQSVGTMPNLDQGQIVSQIQALNNDYGGIGYNSSSYPTSAFISWATNETLPTANLDALGRVKIANCNVQFCLATKDTLGNLLAEPGIERINCVSKGWTNPASINSYSGFKSYMDGTIKPGSIWNVRKYLNVWVTDVNMSAVNLLGYATFPPLTGLSGLSSSGTTNSTDGYWCYAACFGSKTFYPGGTYYPGYERGRTSTHEIGHWLGLRHIWGDGTCASDYCNDTPSASDKNFNTPSYPFKSGSCSNNSPNGEMFMNFMDYTDDPVKYMFTPDQATRIQTAMANSPYRKFLGTHNLCSIESIGATAMFNMIPNVCGTTTVPLLNQSLGTPLPTYSWSASGPGTPNFFPDASSALYVTFNTPGNYTITLSAGNGTTTAYSRTINVHAYPQPVISVPTQTVCTGDNVVLTVSGGNSYAWQPGSLTGSVATYSPISGPKTYTCTATGAGACKKAVTIDMDVQDCTGLTTLNGQENVFSIYPNPANEKLFVRTTNGKEVTAEIIDAVGKQVVKQTCAFRTDKNEAQLDISTLPRGIYILKLTGSEGKQQTFRMIKN